MSQLYVVGVGPGDPLQLTAAARRAIDSADVVFAAERHAALAGHAEPLEPLATAVERIRARLDAGGEVAVLVSGDPCLYSLLGLLSRELGGERIRVVPGVGAIQAFCARMGVLWQDAKVVSGHGRALTVSALGHWVRTNGKVLLFCDSAHGAAWAARALIAEGLEGVRMCVGERLSYPDERLTRGAPEEIAGGEYDPLCMVWIENDLARPGLPPCGIDDDAFARGRIPMTKREIRMQVMAELDVRPDSVVWDVGAGTGSVSVECARACPLGEVCAVEREAEGIALIRENARRFHINNLTAVEGAAPEALRGLPAPTHVFIGGSGGMGGGILAAIPRPARVVATAVTLESAAEWTRLFERAGAANVRFAQIAVSRAEKLGGYHLLRAMNPVFIASGDFGLEESL